MPAATPRSCDSTEVDVRGQIGKTREKQDVGKRAMAIVRHQRARVPLRVIVLGRRKSIVDDEQDPCLAALRKTRHQCLGRRIDFAGVVALRREAAARRVEQPSFGSGRSTTTSRAPSRPTPRSCHVSLRADDDVRRNGVEDFVGDERTVPSLWQDVDPLHTRYQRGHGTLQMVALARTQVRDSLRAIGSVPAARRARPTPQACPRPVARCRGRAR